MKKWLDQINDHIRHSMDGRYGSDELNRFLLVAVLALFVLSMIPGAGFLYLISIVLLVLAWIRMYSWNFAARRKENDQYLKFIAGLKKFLRVQKTKLTGRKNYRFFRCPGCGQEVRVPKGAGHIRITCPKCHTQFDRNA
ncbi:MAG: hypothetical protein VZR02_04185 [Lachnospiraceae bacterium]|nr:hypothetical protein [Lachnospiraceae bacterium]